ncbi:MAG: ABC-F family ATP-binding cassette domain-containing protein [Cyanobacteria bacterium P01_H01_bin.74]
MLQLNAISLSFGSFTLFSDLTLEITTKSRLGLVGRNGAGKSTILKLLMRMVTPQQGSINQSPGLKVNYLSQEPALTLTHTLQEEMRSVYGNIDTLRQEEDNLVKQLEVVFEEDKQAAILERLMAIQDRLAAFDPDSLDARIAKILKTLAFQEEDAEKLTASFSGGWQMRINLAKVLLEGADILLLDEPTNHLDLASCEWLESFLKTYEGGIVMVSHDRHFLDEVTTEIAEVEKGKLTLWPGNYTQYLEQKAAHIERATAAYSRQQKEIEKQTAFVERFKASASRGTQAKSRERQLAKIERLEAPDVDHSKIKVKFPLPDPSGRDVMTLTGVSKSYENLPLFAGVDGYLGRGERIFLLGENGTGKTTFLRLVLGLEPVSSGEINFGYNVKPGYFSQNQLETLDGSKTLFDTLHDISPKLTHTDVRGLLARFLFTGEDVYKKVGVLSGGEKSKVALAKLILSGCNFMLLDEPTNHMDLPSKEVLTQAFKDYEGSILSISHDRYFIDALATQIWEIYNGQVICYAGGYEYYLQKRQELRSKIPRPKKSAPSSSARNADSTMATAKKSPFQQKKDIEKQLKQCEKKIVSLETSIESLSEELNHPGNQQDYGKLVHLNATLEEKKLALTALNTSWEELSNALLVFD